MPALLEAEELEAQYGWTKVLHGVRFSVETGGITTILGANGAGKTTTLKAISGLLRTERGEVTKGSIELGGQRIDHLAAYEVVRRGVVQVFEGRRVFEHLTTEENLIAGAHIQSDRERVATGIERVFQYFPRLKERRTQLAGTLSGGEQQMCAVGRGLMTEPELLMLDEPSLGLAPKLVDEIFGHVEQISKEGVTILLVAQNVSYALQMSETAYLMETGRITLSGSSKSLINNKYIRDAYVGKS